MVSAIFSQVVDSEEMCSMEGIVGSTEEIMGSMVDSTLREGGDSLAITGGSGRRTDLGQ